MTYQPVPLLLQMHQHANLMVSVLGSLVIVKLTREQIHSSKCGFQRMVLQIRMTTY